MTLLSDYIEIEDLSDDALQTSVPNVIFNLPPTAYALVTLDLRHIMAEDYNWVYGEDWEISFTVDPELTIESPSLPIPMPEEFLIPTTARD